MHRKPTPGFRPLAALFALAIFVGTPIAAFAGPMVAVWEKSGFELIVKLGDSSTFSSLSGLNTSIAEFGGSSANADFVIVGVLDRTLTDPVSTLPRPNIVNSTLVLESSSGLTDTSIELTQNRIAGNGTADSWFDRIPTVAGGAPGTQTILSATAANSFANNVGNDAFGALPFSMAGKVDASGNLTIQIWQALGGLTDFGGPAQSITQLYSLNVTPTSVSRAVPEPASLVLIGLGLAVVSSLRRRSD